MAVPRAHPESPTLAEVTPWGHIKATPAGPIVTQGSCCVAHIKTRLQMMLHYFSLMINSHVSISSKCLKVLEVKKRKAGSTCVSPSATMPMNSAQDEFLSTRRVAPIARTLLHFLFALFVLADHTRV